jgi:hypothetical protein
MSLLVFDNLLTVSGPHSDCRVVLIKDEPGNNHGRTSIGGFIEEMLFDNEGNRKKQRVNSIDGDSSSFKRYDSLLDNQLSEVGTGRTLRRRESSPKGDFIVFLIVIISLFFDMCRVFRM